MGKRNIEMRWYETEENEKNVREGLRRIEHNIILDVFNELIFSKMPDAKFIQCSLSTASYFTTIVNKPVNITIVETVKSCTENYYPDNEGTPAIEFTFIGGDKYKWVYERWNISIRDKDYNQIINNLI